MIYCILKNENNNSLQRITVEFWDRDKRRVEKFTSEVTTGENEIRIPISKLNYNWCEELAEICFVIDPKNLLQKEGEFSVEALHVQMDYTNQHF